MKIADAMRLCSYQYDGLDRLARCAPALDSEVQRFYNKIRLACEIEGAVGRSIMQHAGGVLAVQQRGGALVQAALLGVDRQGTVLMAQAEAGRTDIAYSAYGYSSGFSGLMALPSFNGEYRDSVTGHYMLGSGYRAFNPVLMCFNRPDSLSPFGKGGFNAYAYCQGDPVNFTDPTGHFLWFKPRITSTLALPSSAARLTYAKTSAGVIGVQHSGTVNPHTHPLYKSLKPGEQKAFVEAYKKAKGGGGFTTLGRVITESSADTLGGGRRHALTKAERKLQAIGMREVKKRHAMLRALERGDLVVGANGVAVPAVTQKHVRQDSHTNKVLKWLEESPITEGP